MLRSVAVDRLENLRVAVVVLGDLARSPRMRLQAMALAAEGATVEVVGYVESDVPAELDEDPRIRVHEIPSHRSSRPDRASSIWYVTRGILRTFGLAWSLFRALIRVPSLDLILVQNPPLFPTGAITLAVARLRRARLVVDWHNFSYSMLALRLGEEHPVVELARRWEGRVASMADGHLCVSRAMSERLRGTWDIDAAVLYDRPPRIVPTRDENAREDLLCRVWQIDDARDCPLVATATSWTDDEDVAMLIDVARDLDRRMRSQAAPRRLVIIASGDGPNRVAFEKSVERCDLKKVEILTGWLNSEDYETLLACADLGVSLHRSASGVDLPMKIADMRGAGLPVAALDYGTVLGEILDPNVDGLLFSDATELAGIIEKLLLGEDEDELDRIGRTVRERFVATWMDGWTTEALPTIESLKT